MSTFKTLNEACIHFVSEGFKLYTPAEGDHADLTYLRIGSGADSKVIVLQEMSDGTVKAQTYY